MLSSSEEFARYAEAERRLCDEAGPTLTAIVRALEASSGIVVAELRITFDRTTITDEPISANCTIVRAASSLPSDGHEAEAQGRSAKQEAGD